MSSKRPPETRIGIPCLMVIGYLAAAVIGLCSLGLWLA